MSPRLPRFAAPLAAAFVALPLALTSCAPSGSSSSSTTAATGGSADAPAASAVKTDAASLGEVTLTVWDQEVRGGGSEQITKLNAAFQAKYPNIKIQRQTKSFDDLVKTVRLALSGNTPPDVVQINNTRADMGTYVKAKQLLPLTDYAKAYGWNTRYPEVIRAVASYSADGKTFGSGDLYGLPQVGEVVGLYVNEAKLSSLGINPPTNLTELESALATAKSKSETPLMLGNLEKWPAGHVFGMVQGQFVKPEDIRNLAFGNSGGSWKTEANKKAVETLRNWADKGYFNDGFNGMGYDPAWQAFAKGKGLFFVGGTWLQADLAKAMGDNVSFMLPPKAADAGISVATGASGQPWTITSKSKNPDAAAAYINFITSPEAMKIIAETGNLPVVDTAGQKAPNALGQDIFTAYGEVTTSNGLVPYLDWATPTMGDTLGATLQDLLAKKVTPDQALDQLESDYSAFTAKNG